MEASWLAGRRLLPAARGIFVELATGSWFCPSARVKTTPCLTRFLACGLLLIAALPAEEVTLHTGFDYSIGNYGLPVSTEITTIPLSLSYVVNQTTWELSLPYLRINGPGEVVPGIGRYTARLLRSKSVSQGLGDFTMGVTQDFGGAEGRPWTWAAGAEVKFGTASAAKSLGTGENDFATHVDFTFTAGAFTPFATLGYRWLGNPAGSDLRNYVFGTVGVNWACTEKTTLGLLADWAERNSTGGSTSSSFTLSVTRALGEHWQIQAYVVQGNSDATADHGLGLGLSRRF